MDKSKETQPFSAIELLVAAAGTKAALAAALKVSPQAVSKWVRSGRVPAGRVLAAEAATCGKVTRYQIRPDVFGPLPPPP